MLGMRGLQMSCALALQTTRALVIVASMLLYQPRTQAQGENALARARGVLGEDATNEGGCRSSRGWCSDIVQPYINFHLLTIIFNSNKERFLLIG